MLPQRRHAEIVRRLDREGSASVTALAAQLDTSPATIRRDLIVLERTGELTRVHGGAVRDCGYERPFDSVAGQPRAERHAVAKAAAGLVRDGDAVLLDIGTTTHALAGCLHGRPITVLTPNLAVYEELSGDPAIELVLLGGVVRRNYRSTVGYLTEDALRQVRADRLFLGASGVRADGSVMDDTVVQVPVKRAMLAAADRVVLLADRGKFPGCGLARICGADRLDTLVTNYGTGDRTLRAFTEAEVEVVLA